jgi:hypothetical protein
VLQGNYLYRLLTVYVKLEVLVDLVVRLVQLQSLAGSNIEVSGDWNRPVIGPPTVNSWVAEPYK